MAELSIAASHGNVQRVRELLEAGVDVHAKDDEALRNASENGYLEVVRLLLDAGADVHARHDYALVWASEKGRLEVVRLLLQAGANVHASNDFALRWASAKGHVEVVRILLQVGAEASKIYPRFYQSMAAVQLGLYYHAPNIPQDQLARYQTYSFLLNMHYYKELSHSILGYL